jgi:hypothetical protein
MTTKLLDIIIALSPRSQNLNSKQRKALRQEINTKLYNKTRSGFYWEAADSLHIAYAGQPKGANTQHHWRIFCDDSLKTQIETLIAGTALTTSAPSTEPSGNYTKEWGGLYLRSEAEVRIAEALDLAGVLFLPMHEDEWDFKPPVSVTRSLQVALKLIFLFSIMVDAFH